jgi:hypothetical protein
MRRVRVLRACCFAAVLTCVAPVAHAASPLALLGKELLKQALKDFFQSQLASLSQESLSPCKSMLANPAGSGAMPGMNALIGQIDPATLAQMDPATRAQAAQMMAALQAMQSAPPLSSAEVDELVDRLVKVSKAIPDHELPCSPQELKLAFGASASMPMGAGGFRMMLDALREMDGQLKKIQDCFDQMSPAEREEAIDLIVAEAASLGADERKQVAGFLQSEISGVPAPVRERLRERFAALR